MIKPLTTLLLLLLSACGRPAQPPAADRPPQRIISLAPNTTEMLFALGLGERVVAVSSYCSYPPEAAALPRIGALYNANLEKVAALRPDLVVGLGTQQEMVSNLRRLNIPFVGVAHEHIADILHAVRLLGDACGAQEQAGELVLRLRQEIEAARFHPESGTPAGPRPSVLICISRDEAARRCYIAGPDSFYDELILLAGGTNACTSPALRYPEISPEGLIALAPDLIIDIGPTAGPDAWRAYPSLPAVQQDRLLIITNDYASIPGPRFTQLLRDISNAIQP